MAPEEKKPSFSRVLFIGAGFSAGMQYPVGATLMSHLMKYLKLEDAQKELLDLGFTNLLKEGMDHRLKAE